MPRMPKYDDPLVCVTIIYYTLYNKIFLIIFMIYSLE